MNPSKSAISRRAVLVGGASAAAVAAGAGIAGADPESKGHNMTQTAIDEVAAELEDDLIALRRDLHAHPELAGKEERTSRVVAKRLRRAGLAVTPGVGGYGVVAVLKGSRPGRTVAYRADMDAVPPDEQNGGDGETAHLCGHDIHTTVGVGVAEVLARLRKRLRGTVVFFFQPAEETLDGAQAMIDADVLGDYRPEEIHALHCGPFWAGEFGVMPGSGLPGQDYPTIVLSGPDAVEQSRRLAGELNELSTVAFPESPADLEQLVADLQTPDGPLARFIALRTRPGAPDANGRVTVPATYRCWPQERYTEIRETIRGIAASYEGAEVSFKDPFPAMVVPEREGHAVKRHLSEVFGPEAVKRVHAAVPFSGEDYALFLNEIPGTFTFLGVGKPDSGIETSYPHFGTFDPDERAIGFGVRGMAGWLANRCRD